MGINVFDMAKSVSITTVVGHYVTLRHKGSRAYGLCPFHNDKHIGSFVVSENTGKFVCYACGEKGDNIDFVSHICGIDSREAAITICEEEALISHSDACDLRERRIRDVVVMNTPKTVYKKPDLLLSSRATPIHLHRVYSCFTRAARPLSEGELNLLHTERHLSGDDIKDFFHFPDRNEEREFWVRFREELAKEFEVRNEDIQDKLLLGVPGFFLDNNANIKFSTSKMPSLGIIIHSRNKKISGIQMRRTGELNGKEARYTLLSSGFADGAPKSYGSFGCNSGYIEDVLYPQKKWNGTIALTEGRFKAITLSKMGCLVVNMHSISNWSPAGDVALDLVGAFPQAKHFLLAYDSEQNENVFKSAESLYGKLRDTRSVYFAVWDPKYGKGIDDVVNAGHQGQLRSVSPEEFFPNLGNDAKAS